MRRFFFFLLVLGLGGTGSLRADVNVQAAQRGLKQAGFYFGDTTGVYDSETAAALTRFQIRNGLPINGKLDAATAKALGVASAKNSAETPEPASGTWRRLRNGDMQFLKQLNSGATPSPHSPGRVVAPQLAKAQMDPHRPPPPVEDSSGRLTGTPVLAPSRTGLTERLRDYVGAFVLAGLDPQVGAELEFFADQVDYFGERNVAL
jgi:peptidoglycan hydrolase-like protein with peptidoglycan-binding domain